MKNILKLSPIIFLFLLGCKEEIDPFTDAYGYYVGVSYDERVYTPDSYKIDKFCGGGSMQIQSREGDEIYLFAYCNAYQTNGNNFSRFENLRIGASLVDSVYVRITHPSYWKIRYGIFDTKTNKQIGYIGKQRIDLPRNNPVSYIDEMYMYIPLVISNQGDSLIRYFGKKQFKEMKY